MNNMTPVNTSSSTAGLDMWEPRLQQTPAVVKLGLRPAEFLPVWIDLPRLCWPSLNHLFIWVGCLKINTKKLEYIDMAHSTQCDCGEEQTMPHVLYCRQLDELCTQEDPVVECRKNAPRNRDTLCEGHDKKNW